MLDFIYKLSKQEHLDRNKLFDIDPYADVEVPKKDLPQIIEICNYILNTSLIQSYKEPEEGSQMLKDLVEIAKEARSRDLGLVSIGD